MWKTFQKHFDINENIINTLETVFKFDKITKVQNIVIPEFLKNKDVIVKSCTGSGKTHSYLIPLLQRLIQFKTESESDIKDKILSVILLPTRELSIQVYNNLLLFLENFEEKFKFSSGLFIGGKKIQKDLDKLSIETPNIIVATVGRITDLEEKVKLSFKDLQILILDEADKMFELGYEMKVTCLIEKFPKHRRTGLFSATINSQIQNLIKAGMRNPIFIDIKINFENNSNEEIFVTDDQLANIKHKKKKCDYFEIMELNFNEDTEKKEKIFNTSQEVPTQLEQFYYLFSNIQYKLPYMISLLKSEETECSKVMIFFATCNSVDYFSIIMPKLIEGYQFYKLHSKITQKKRKTEYKNFLKSKKGVLLTTDLSARGIDVPNVDLIIQFDPPKNEEVYIHRVGRTARVGNKGRSFLLLDKNELKFINVMDHKNIKIFPTEENENLDINEMNQKLKSLNTSDKWIYDKAVKTFVSFTRFYMEHDLKYIFDFKLVDIGNLANSLGLLRIPRIKEILGKKIENFEQDESINPKELAYINLNTAKQMEEKEM